LSVQLLTYKITSVKLFRLFKQALMVCSASLAIMTTDI